MSFTDKFDPATPAIKMYEALMKFMGDVHLLGITMPKECPLKIMLPKRSQLFALYCSILSQKHSGMMCFEEVRVQHAGQAVWEHETYLRLETPFGTVLIGAQR